MAKQNWKIERGLNRGINPEMIESIIRINLLSDCLLSDSDSSKFSEEFFSSPLNQKFFLFSKRLRKRMQHLPESIQKGFLWEWSFLSHAPKKFIKERDFSHLAEITLSYYELLFELVQTQKIFEMGCLPHIVWKRKISCLGILFAWKRQEYSHKFQEEDFIQLLSPIEDSLSFIPSSFFVKSVKEHSLIFVYGEVTLQQPWQIPRSVQKRIEKNVRENLNKCIHKMKISLSQRFGHTPYYHQIEEMSRQMRQNAPTPHVKVLSVNLNKRNCFIEFILSYPGERMQLEEMLVHSKGSCEKNHFKIEDIRLINRIYPQAKIYFIVCSTTTVSFVEKQAAFNRENILLSFYDHLESLMKEGLMSEEKSYLKERNHWLTFYLSLFTLKKEKNAFAKNLFHQLFPLKGFSESLIRALYMGACYLKEIKPPFHITEINKQRKQSDQWSLFSLAFNDSDFPRWIEEKIGEDHLLEGEALYFTDTSHADFSVMLILVDKQQQKCQFVEQKIEQWIKEWTEMRQREQIFHTFCSFEPSIRQKRLDPQYAHFLHLLFRTSAIGREQGNHLFSSCIPNSDFSSYLITLHDDLFWHDGNVLLAQDVIDSWTELLKPGIHFPHLYLLYIIKNSWLIKNRTLSPFDLGVRCIDEKSLIVELDFPSLYFPERLIQFPFLCMHRKRCNGSTDRCLSIKPFEDTHGFFVYQKQTPSSIELVARPPLQRESSPFQLKKWHFSLANRELSLEKSYKEEWDWLGAPFSTLSLQLLKRLHRDKKLRKAYTQRVVGIHFPPHSLIKRVRKLLTQAICVRELSNQIGNDLFPPAYMPFSAWNSCTMEFSGQREKSLTELRREYLTLKECKKFPSQIKIHHSHTEMEEKIALHIKKRWEQMFCIPVHVSTTKEEPTDFSEIFIYTMFAPSRNPLLTLEGFQSGFTHESHITYQWADKKYREIIRKLHKNLSKEEQNTLISKALSLFMAECLYFPLLFLPDYYVHNQRIQGIKIDHHNFLFSFQKVHRLHFPPKNIRQVQKSFFEQIPLAHPT